MLITSATDHPRTAAPDVVLRTARPQDGPALRRLAALDDAAPLAGAVLVAEQSCELRAALSLHSGRAIADPFHPTADLVALLRARAALLSDAADSGHRVGRLFRRAVRPA